jgi:ElaB/YqjD/DUF883 family membrane-anchored ribosome-binding protein
MADETEVIRQQMEETRTSLTEKLEALHGQVSSTVKDTTESVTETAQTVTETVQSVTQVFDIGGHVERHPWAMVGGGLVLGYALGYLLTPSRESAPSSSGWAPNWSGYTGQPSGPASTATGSSLASGMSQASASPPAAPSSAAEQPSMIGDALKSFADSFGPVFDQLKGLAIGATTGVLGEMLVKALPENLGQSLSGMVDEVTRSLGGQVLRPQGEQAGGHEASGPATAHTHQPSGQGQGQGESHKQGHLQGHRS